MDAELRTILKTLVDGQARLEKRLDKGLEGLQNRVELLEKRQEQLEKGQEMILEKLAEQSLLIKSIREGQEIHQAKIEAIEKKLDAQANDTPTPDDYHATMAKLNARYKELQQELDVRIAKMDADAVVTNVKIQEVENSQKFLRNKVVEHQQELFFLKKNA